MKLVDNIQFGLQLNTLGYGFKALHTNVHAYWYTAILSMTVPQ